MADWSPGGLPTRRGRLTDMAIALCLLSAMVLGVGFVLQQHAAEQASRPASSGSG